jgi:hypothetical protein
MSDEGDRPARGMAMQNQDGVLKSLVWLVGILGGILFLGGVVTCFYRLSGQTQITLFGQQLDTTAVGVAVIFIGALMVVFTVRPILKTLESANRISPGSPPKSMKDGRIEQPSHGQKVNKTCECSGWVKNIDAGSHLWLAVEVNGLIWFKEGEIHPDKNNKWNAIVFEDGATKEFALALYIADESAHQRILEWINDGKRTGQYSQLDRVVGAQRLHRIDKLRLKQK